MKNSNLLLYLILSMFIMIGLLCPQYIETYTNPPVSNIKYGLVPLKNTNSMPAKQVRLYKYDITFQSDDKNKPFTSVPYIFTELIGETVSTPNFRLDSYQTTVSNVSLTGFTLNVIRMGGDLGGQWGQNLKIYFMAIAVDSMPSNAPTDSISL